MQDKISKSVTFLSIFIFSLASFYLHCIALSSVILAFAVVLAWLFKVISRRFAIVLMLIFALGMLYAEFRTPDGDGLQKYIFKEETITGVVKSVPKYNNSKLKFYFSVEKVGADSGDLGTSAVSIFSDEPADFSVGDRISLRGKFSAPHGAKNFGQFDYANYLKNQGVFTVFYADEYKFLVQSDHWGLRVQAFFDKLTQKIMSKYAKFLSKNQADLLGGIVFGHKSVELDSVIEQNFINSGVFHVLAASGMQIGLVLFFWYYIAKFLRISYSVSMLTGAVLIVIYAAFTGFPPSIVRALLMAEFIILGKLIDRQADSVALLLFVAVLMLLYNPLSIMDVGFQLSFVTTFGLIFCMPKFVEKLKFLPDIVSGTLVMTIVAQLFASPLLVFYFNNISLYSLFANILIIPFVSIITFAGFVSSFVALLPNTDWFVRIVAFCLKPFLGGMNLVAEFFSHLPNSLIYVAQIEIFSVVLAYLVIIFAVLALNYHLKSKILNSISVLGLVILIALNTSFLPSKNLEVVFFDVGNSDAILLKTPQDKAILIDTGRANPYGASSGKTVIAEYLKAIGRKKLDAIILTHPDSDHIGGCCDVLDFADNACVYEAGTQSDTSTYCEMHKYFAQNKTKVVRLSEGQSLDLSFDKSLKINLLAPSGRDGNNSSLITFVEYGAFSGLFLGDNEKEVLPFIRRRLQSPVTLLKVGHHGSRASLDGKMLSVLSPQNAVISVGKNNFGHPSNDVIELLDVNQVRTYRTDRDNMVVFCTDGRKTTAKRYCPWTKRIE